VKVHFIKKKYFILCFLSLFLLFISRAHVFSAALGDTNENGTIDIVDALLIAQFYVGLEPANFNSDYADTNCSGTVDIVDALLVAQFYVGLIDSFPCSETPEPTDQSTETPVTTSPPTTTPVPTNSPPEGFVVRVGSRLGLNGKTFFYNGTNQYYLFYKSEQMIDEVFEDAAGLGLTAMRTWGFCDGEDKQGYVFQPQAGVYDEATFEHFDYVVWKAGQVGIRLIVPFVNNWDDMGGMNQYVQWSSTSSSHDDFYTDSWCRNAYKDYIFHFLNRVNSITGIAYKNDPTFMIWELGNEPRCGSDKSGTKLQAWIDEMSSHIKSIDSNHMVSTGSEGFYSGGAGYLYDGSEGMDFIRNHEGQHIDICSVHLYPHHWNITAEQGTDWIEEHVLDGKNILGKPVYLGEYGWHIDDGGISNRNQVFTEWFEILDETNADGANFWLLSGHEDDGTLYQDYDGFTVYYPEDSSTCIIIQNYSNKVAEKSGQTLDVTPPSISITTPSSNAAVNGDVTISGSATDDMGLAKVDVCLNGGIWRNPSGTSSWSYTWPSAEWVDGTHTIQARAIDNQNNMTTVQIRVTTNNGTGSSDDWKIEAYKEQDDGYWLIYHLRATNTSGAAVSGELTFRFYIIPDGTTEIRNYYEESETYVGNPATSNFIDDASGVQYYEIRMGSRSIGSNEYIGFKGHLYQGDAGFNSANDWSSSQIPSTSFGTVTHMTLYKDGQIIAGIQP
jgi:mannan endo-1,4-beta-mannosidase